MGGLGGLVWIGMVSSSGREGCVVGGVFFQFGGSSEWKCSRLEDRLSDKVEWEIKRRAR